VRRHASEASHLSLSPIKAANHRQPLASTYVPLPGELLRGERSPDGDDHAKGQGQDAHTHHSRVLEQERRPQGGAFALPGLFEGGNRSGRRRDLAGTCHGCVGVLSFGFVCAEWGERQV
jgi:hypothetical protein